MTVVKVNRRFGRNGRWHQSDVEGFWTLLIEETNRLVRPGILWESETPPRSVEAYFNAHAGEFDCEGLSSDYPYSGPASRYFVLSPEKDPRPHLERFDHIPAPCWEVPTRKILNPLTADLLAAAEFLGSEIGSSSTSGPPGGFGADAHRTWMPLLDGGVGFDLQIYQDEWTNRVSGAQRTVVRGPRAYRVLLELLGFSWINRPLPGERMMPRRGDICRSMSELLNSSKTQRADQTAPT